jgi:BirA family biotin operon repressor/biotin-[acetyl-CoA-carboxylase] ligase
MPEFSFGFIVFAQEQTAGKGQRGKVWESEKNANILMSVVMRPNLDVSEQFNLLACVAVTVHQFFSRYSHGDASIKWPNDLYWKDKKAGGILIESVIGRSQDDLPEWHWAIIGIGININQASFPQTATHAVSLKQITGKEHDPLSLSKELYLDLQENFTRLSKDGFEEIYAYYLKHLYKLNQAVRLKKDNVVFDAIIKSVSRTGKIIVDQGMEKEYTFGEVELVSGY